MKRYRVRVRRTDREEEIAYDTEAESFVDVVKAISHNESKVDAIRIYTIKPSILLRSTNAEAAIARLRAEGKCTTCGGIGRVTLGSPPYVTDDCPDCESWDAGKGKE